MSVRNYFFLLLLPALVIACSLTASPVAGDQVGAMQPAEVPVKIDLEGAAQSAPDQGSPSPVPTAESCIVTADVLQLRACAGTHCTVTDWLEQGEELTVLESGNDWIQVQASAGMMGWVKAKYCGEQP